MLKMIRRFKVGKVGKMAVCPCEYFTFSPRYGKDICNCGMSGRFNNRISPCFESVWRYDVGRGIVKVCRPHIHDMGLVVRLVERLAELYCGTYCKVVASNVL